MPNGTDAQPTSIWPVITCVSVAGMPPVDTGLTVSLFWRANSRSAAWLEEPVTENPTDLPLSSTTARTGEAGTTYQ